MYLTVQAPRAGFDRSVRSKNMRVHLCPAHGELQPRKGEAGAEASGGYPGNSDGGAEPLTRAASAGAGAGAACGQAPGAGAVAVSKRQGGASPAAKHSFADAVQRLGLRQGNDIVLRRRNIGGEGGRGGGGGLGASGPAALQAAGGGGLRDEPAETRAGCTEAPAVPTVWLEGRPKVLELLPLQDVPPRVAESLRAAAAAAAAAASTAALRAEVAYLAASNATAPASLATSPHIPGMPAGGVPSAAAERAQSLEPTVRGQTRGSTSTAVKKENLFSPASCAKRVEADERSTAPPPAAGGGGERLAAEVTASTAAVGVLESEAAGREEYRGGPRGGGEGGSAGIAKGPAAGGVRDAGGTPAPVPKRRRPLHGGWVPVGSELTAAAAATRHACERGGQQQQPKGEGEQVGLTCERAVERLQLQQQQQQQQLERRGMALGGGGNLLPRLDHVRLHAQGPERLGQGQEIGEGRGKGQGRQYGKRQAGRHGEEEGDGDGAPRGERQGEGERQQRRLGTGPAVNATARIAHAGSGSTTPSAQLELTRTGVQRSAIMLTAKSAAGLFPGMWRRLQAHLDAGVQVRSRSMPVTLVLASLPEGDPGREVQVRREQGVVLSVFWAMRAPGVGFGCQGLRRVQQACACSQSQSVDGSP